MTSVFRKSHFAVLGLSGLVVLLMGLQEAAVRAADKEPSKSSKKKASEDGCTQEKSSDAKSSEDKKKEPPDPRSIPTHEKTTVIKFSGKGSGRLNNFCLNRDGNLLACCGSVARKVAEEEEKESSSKSSASNAEIRVLSPEGKQIGAWKVDFTPQAITVDADGTIYAGGGGRVAKLDQSGKVLLSVESPVLADAREAKAKKAAIADVEDETPADKKATAKKKKNSSADQETSRDEKTAKDQKAKKEKKKKDSEKAKAAKKSPSLLESLGRSLGSALGGPVTDAMKTPDEDDKANEAKQREKEMERYLEMRRNEVTGIAVTGRDVFISCPASEGYGFAVYRMDRDLANPKKIIENLRGCCGQMDVQTKDGEVWVPENARHRVTRYDRDGKQLSSWGLRSRSKIEGFGGCCEPKNIRFGSDGSVYTSESGSPERVKRFTPEGKFVEVVAAPKFNGGCVRVTVAVSADTERVFVQNTGGSEIHVFARKKPSEAKPAADKEKDKDKDKDS